MASTHVQPDTAVTLGAAPSPTHLAKLDEMAQAARLLGACEIGGGGRGGSTVLNHGDTQDQWIRTLNQVGETYGNEFALTLDSIFGVCLCAETQRSLLRGFLHGWAMHDGTLLDDDAVTALVDRYVEIHG